MGSGPQGPAGSLCRWSGSSAGLWDWVLERGSHQDSEQAQTGAGQERGQRSTVQSCPRTQQRSPWGKRKPMTQAVPLAPASKDRVLEDAPSRRHRPWWPEHPGSPRGRAGDHVASSCECD